MRADFVLPNGASDFGGSDLRSWRQRRPRKLAGSRLQTVYRGIEIGTEAGKCRASFARPGSSTVGFVRQAWVADSTPLLIHMAGERTNERLRSGAVKGCLTNRSVAAKRRTLTHL